MTTSKTNKQTTGAESDNSNPQFDPFRLEGIFDNVGQIFKPHKVADASSPDVIIAVDTSVLLLPYTIRKDGLPTLQEFYQKLRSANRLFLPARVAREFITNRDRKLSELLKMLGDVKSRINIGEKKVSPILDGVEGSDEIIAASQLLTEAKQKYIAALEKVESKVQAWSGDDPVTSIYDAVFDDANIISPIESPENMLAEWRTRLSEQIPPGYKDGHKDDSGIGDFLIWKSLLALGATRKRDLIFVTGEEKADWFVRSNNRSAYPRPELIAEFRKHSEGKNIRLVEFHEVLREMSVPPEIVTEVENAENTANSIVRETSLSEERQRAPFNVKAYAPLSTSSIAEFKVQYGGQDIVFSSEGVIFKFQISEQQENSLWAYPNGIDAMTGIRVGTIGTRLEITSMTGVDSPFSIAKGQMVVARNAAGFTLVARLMRANNPPTNQPFESAFMFSIFPPGSRIVVP